VAPEDRSTEFVAVQGGGNTTSAEALLVTAYIVMWALLLLFVFFTWRRQQKMEARVIDLERALSQAEKEEARGTPALRES
jgi:CcmD family protein